MGIDVDGAMVGVVHEVDHMVAKAWIACQIQSRFHYHLLGEVFHLE